MRVWCGGLRAYERARRVKELTGPRFRLVLGDARRAPGARDADGDARHGRRRRVTAANVRWKELNGSLTRVQGAGGRPVVPLSLGASKRATRGRFKLRR